MLKKNRDELNFTKSTGKMNRETETYIFLVSNNDRKKDSRKTPFISLISTLKKWAENVNITDCDNTSNGFYKLVRIILTVLFI